MSILRNYPVAVSNLRVEGHLGSWTGGGGSHVASLGTLTGAQAALLNGPQSGLTGAQLGPNLDQPRPNWGPYGMLLGEGGGTQCRMSNLRNG